MALGFNLDISNALSISPKVCFSYFFLVIPAASSCLALVYHSIGNSTGFACVKLVIYMDLEI